MEFINSEFLKEEQNHRVMEQKGACRKGFNDYQQTFIDSVIFAALATDAPQRSDHDGLAENVLKTMSSIRKWSAGNT